MILPLPPRALGELPLNGLPSLPAKLVGWRFVSVEGDQKQCGGRCFLRGKALELERHLGFFAANGTWIYAAFACRNPLGLSFATVLMLCAWFAMSDFTWLLGRRL